MGIKRAKHWCFVAFMIIIIIIVVVVVVVYAPRNVSSDQMEIEDLVGKIGQDIT